MRFLEEITISGSWTILKKNSNFSFFLRNWTIYHLHSAPKAHDRKVAVIQKQVFFAHMFYVVRSGPRMERLWTKKENVQRPTRMAHHELQVSQVQKGYGTYKNRPARRHFGGKIQFRKIGFIAKLDFVLKFQIFKNFQFLVLLFKFFSNF